MRAKYINDQTGHYKICIYYKFCQLHIYSNSWSSEVILQPPRPAPQLTVTKISTTPNGDCGLSGAGQAVQLRCGSNSYKNV